ncbi:EAL domain-containing protein [Methylophaga sp.]|uniref:bifunctional diguanylate cyclase/phosphodiesterase n=1 Tax=Methylophaga sp. TaxID=2024840 RepID=UPI00271FEDAA|nr:EAL domain-containing protein [Methylophaga sp.]MDO8827581.1 EAL domain-containing protein [Methylophaga sp.]
MKSKGLPTGADTAGEITHLIQIFIETGWRLQELTGGQGDVVEGPDGQMCLLRHGLAPLRLIEAFRQTAILNALPANIALLDNHGTIISVNDAWRVFSDTNAIQSPGYGIGLNYLEICDRAEGEYTAGAQQAAAGIRSVLDGSAALFSMEYPCDTTTEQRWFQMTVTPLIDDSSSGGVVMHVDITERKQLERVLIENEDYFRFLNTLTDATRLLIEPVEIMAVMTRMLGEQLQVSRCAYADVESNGEQFAILYDYTDGCQSTVGQYQLSLFGPKADAMLTLGETLVIHNVDGELLSGEGQEMFNAIGIKAVIICPLVKGGKLRAMMAVHQLTPRDWTPKEVVIVQDVVERCWAIIERRIAEDKLGKNEAMLRLAGRIAKLGGWSIGLPDYHVTWSDEVCAIFEVPADTSPEFERVLSFHTLQSREVISKAIEDCVADGTPFDIELQVMTAKGRLSYIRCIGKAEYNAQGVITKLYGTVQDISERHRSEQEIVKTLERLTEAQRIGKMGDWEWDIAGGTILWSPQVFEIIGRDPDLGSPRDFDEALTYYDAASQILLRERVAMAISSGEPQSYELVVVRPNGERLYVQANAVPRKAKSGEVLGLYGTIQDITESKTDNLKIRYLNRVYSMLSSINTLMVRERDLNELYRAACNIAVESGGFYIALICIVDPATQLINLAASAGKDEKFLAAIKQLIASTDTASETMIARAIREQTAIVSNDSQSDSQIVLDNEYAEAGIRSTAVLPLIIDNEAAGVIALYSSEAGAFHDEEVTLLRELAGDIAFASDSIQKQTRTDYLAYYDVLTGLANRTLFYERVGQYIRSATDNGHKLAIFLINLERFKNFNDSLGRSAGDMLLKQVAEWLTHETGDANLLARIGADHFAIVLPNLRREAPLARLLDKSIKAFLDQPFHIAGTDYRISTKVGVALFPDDGDDVDTLYNNAETALKQTKTQGVHYLRYSHEMTKSVASELTLENQLRRAVDNGEFVLHYQPKVNLKTGKLTSAEALIRWNDPQTGLVPPGRFIHILEETGLIFDVGHWVIKQAVEDYLRWCNNGLAAVPIAVNVSSLQLRDPGFIAEIEQAIGVDARASAGLELEITESLVMENIRRNIISLQAIRDMGLRIAIDDFGTGFSSLSYLAKLPVDTLKIDRSFIIDMTNGPEGLALVSTIISLAHSLRLKVVAEGVETDEQSRLLSLLNCDEIQGFLISKPLPIEIFETRCLALTDPHDIL